MKKLEKVGPFPLSFVFYALIEVKTSVFATVCLPFVLKLKLFKYVTYQNSTYIYSKSER